MIKRLLSIRLRGTFLAAVGGKDKNGNPKSVSKARIAVYAFLYAFLALTFIGLIFTFAAPLAMILLPLGGEDMYFGVFILLSLTAIFIFSIFETKTELYECKDNELLLAMPIAPRDIVVSRIFTVLIYNYIEELIILIPILICYIVFGGGAVGILGALFIFATVPLVATALAAAVGYAVHLISHKIGKYKNLIIMILSIGFLSLYMIGYTALMANMETVFEDLENNFEGIAEKYSIVSVIGSIATFDLIPFLIYALSVAAVSACAVLVISRKYMSLLTSTVKTGKTVYVARALKGKSPLMSLTKKEFSKILSSPTYMLNGALGFLFQILAAVLIAVMGPKLLSLDPEMLAELGMSEAAVGKLSIPLFVSILVLAGSMNMLSCSALSLEGKNLWILKSMPIPAATVLFAKAMPQILLSAAFSLVAGLIAGIGIGASVTDVSFFVLIPAAFGTFSALFGITANVLLPKFDFVNDVQVIKQSTACFICLLVNMLTGAGVTALSVASISAKYPSLVLLAILAVLAALCAVLWFAIRGPLSRRYSKL